MPLPSCYRALIRHIIIFYERVRSADAKGTRFDPAATAAPKIPSRFVSFRFEFHDLIPFASPERLPSGSLSALPLNLSFATPINNTLDLESPT
jgi:hypothetical protein